METETNENLQNTLLKVSQTDSTQKFTTVNGSIFNHHSGTMARAFHIVCFLACTVVSIVESKSHHGKFKEPSVPATASGIANCEGGKDIIHELPGYDSNLPSTMYSGFIEVNATANVSRSLIVHFLLALRKILTIHFN